MLFVNSRPTETLTMHSRC